MGIHHALPAGIRKVDQEVRASSLVSPSQKRFCASAEPQPEATFGFSDLSVAGDEPPSAFASALGNGGECRHMVVVLSVLVRGRETATTRSAGSWPKRPCRAP